MKIETPDSEMLPSYRAALAQGWSPDNARPEAALEQLNASMVDPETFVSLMIDREATGGPVKLPDGTQVARLPSIRLWMWDGEFAGSIGLRWQKGTEELPPHCLGHIGYAVVPWKRRLGYATEALRQILPYARAEGLRYVVLTTDPHNEPSQKAIDANGGVMVESFKKPESQGARLGLRWRIDLLHYSCIFLGL